MEEEDAYSDDSSESESELQQNIEQLQAAIEGSPFHYDSHVQLIGLLRQLGDLDGARKARNAMSDVFPLNEDLWLEWLRDELPLGSVAEAGMELRQLFERATQDYLSTAVWLLYAQFAVDQMSLSPDGVEFPRDVFEGAIVSCGLHVSKAGELWDTYREFETAVFTSLQQMQQNSLEDESLKSQVEAQYERVDKLFKRQLAVPLIGMQDTLTQYQQFSESATSEDSLPAYSRALKRLEAVLPFENDLSSSSPPSLDAYRSYISHIKTSKEDPMFINTLYQRAMADHCLEVDLWKDYITYLSGSFSKVSSVLLPPHRQAVRNCPWVAELWVSYGRSLERVGAAELETVAVFEKGLSGGSLSSPKDSLQVWTAYLDYLRRRVRIHDDQEGAGPDLVGLRKTFKRARDTLETDFGRHGDPTDSLACYQASLEARCYGNLEESRFLWDDVMGRHGREARFWIQYAEMELHYGNVELCRKILNRGVSSASDDPELMVERFLQFEREEGDLSSYETALVKCASQMRRVEERREKVAQKESQQKDGKKQRKKTEKTQKKAPASGEGGKQQQQHKQQQPRQQQHKQQQQKAGDKRKRDQKGHVFFEEDEDEKREEVEAPTKKPKLKDDKDTSTAVTVSTGDQVSMETTPVVATETKRIIPEPPGRPTKNVSEGERGEEGERREGEGGEEGERREGERGEGERGEGGEGEKEKEKRTVFVSNLKMSITKEDVEGKFAECGPITEVRLVKTQSRGRANAFAYVEFSSLDSVQRALQLEHSELKGRMVFVSLVKEKGNQGNQKAGFKGDNKATVFVSNIQHNMDEDTLKSLFEKCGEVKEVRLVRNRDGRPKGFAYVEYAQESSVSTAVMQLDNHLLGLKRLKVSISNPPKRKGDSESSNRAAGQGAQFSHGSSQLKQAGPIREVVNFVRPAFVPSRLRTQDPSQPPDGPKKRANFGLVPRVLAKHGGKEGQTAGVAGEREGGTGEAMDVAAAKSDSKMSNDDFRNFFKN